MRNLIVLIFIFIGFIGYSQTPPRTVCSGQYGVNPMKWKMVKPLWLDSGAYITKISKNTNQLRHLTYDSTTGKIYWDYVRSSGGSTYSAGNGLILGGTTFYVDTTKLVSKYGSQTINGIKTFNNNLLFTDNTYDIGASGATRPRTGYFGTSLFSPLIVGGTSTTQDLTFKTTTGVGATGANILFKVGNNGSITPLTLKNNGDIHIGGYPLIVADNNDLQINSIFLKLNGRFSVGVGNYPIGWLTIDRSPTASANYATVNIGGGNFSGSGFTGSSSGTSLMISEVSGYAGDFVNFGKGTTSYFKVNNVGNTTVVGRLTAANFYSGSYTPTITGVTNISSSTAYTTSYTRTDSSVTVYGQVTISPTSNNTRTTFGVSLPIASNFSNAYQAGGNGYTIANTTAGHGMAIYSDATNDRVEFDYYETHSSPDTFVFQFTYKIR